MKGKFITQEINAIGLCVPKIGRKRSRGRREVQNGLRLHDERFPHERIPYVVRDEYFSVNGRPQPDIGRVKWTKATTLFTKIPRSNKQANSPFQLEPQFIMNLYV